MICILAFAVDISLFSSLLLGREPLEGLQRFIVPAYAAFGAALLVWRRQAPLVVFTLLLLHSLLALAITPEYHPTASLLAGIAAMAETRPTAVSLTAAALAMIPNAFNIGQNAQYSAPEVRTSEMVVSATAYTMLNLGSWLIGRRTGKHNQRLQVAERRRLAAQERERSRAESVLAERQRIGRELHDIVAHSVTLMVLHAAAAGRVLDQAPEISKQSLRTIESTGTQAMAELRRMLDVLRQSGYSEPISEASATRAGLHRLDELVEGATVDKLTVNVHVSGTAKRLDPSVDLAAYRFLQEALTNVARHAGPGTTADISIQWGQGWVSLAVEDDGAGEPDQNTKAFSTGSGLIGLRERITIAGGTMAAGPMLGRGFHIAARLPVATAGENPTAIAPEESSPRSDIEDRTERRRLKRISRPDNPLAAWTHRRIAG